MQINVFTFNKKVIEYYLYLKQQKTREKTREKLNICVNIEITLKFIKKLI